MIIIIEDFVLKWFYENKLFNTFFQRLPLEILTKIWTIIRNVEKNNVIEILSIHIHYKLQSMGRNIFYRDELQLFAYRNENNICILPEIYEEMKMLTFFKIHLLQRPWSNGQKPIAF